MVRRLKETLLAGGKVYPAGTAETPALADAVPDPRRWDGEADKPSAPDQPPRAGRGSGLEAWREYAEAVGVKVSPDDSRDDIISAVERQS